MIEDIFKNEKLEDFISVTSKGMKDAAKDAKILAKVAKNKAAKTARKIKLASGRIADEIREDIEAVRQRDPAAKSDVEIVLLYMKIYFQIVYELFPDQN